MTFEIVNVVQICKTWSTVQNQLIKNIKMRVLIKVIFELLALRSGKVLSLTNKPFVEPCIGFLC